MLSKRRRILRIVTNRNRGSWPIHSIDPGNRGDNDSCGRLCWPACEHGVIRDMKFSARCTTEDQSGLTLLCSRVRNNRSQGRTVRNKFAREQGPLPTNQWGKPKGIRDRAEHLTVLEMWVASKLAATDRYYQIPSPGKNTPQQLSQAIGAHPPHPHTSMLPLARPCPTMQMHAFSLESPTAFLFTHQSRQAARGCQELREHGECTFFFRTRRY